MGSILITFCKELDKSWKSWLDGSIPPFSKSAAEPTSQHTPRNFWVFWVKRGYFLIILQLKMPFFNKKSHSKEKGEP
jgi:hypothetical protein